jgi:hypothetical protein
MKTHTYVEHALREQARLARRVVAAKVHGGWQMYDTLNHRHFGTIFGTLDGCEAAIKRMRVK